MNFLPAKMWYNHTFSFKKDALSRRGTRMDVNNYEVIIALMAWSMKEVVKMETNG